MLLDALLSLLLYVSQLWKARCIGQVIAVMLLLWSPSLLAQYNTGAVVGTVTDPSGAAVANARITLHDVNRRLEQKAEATGKGDYSFSSVPAGNYVVSVMIPGYETVSTKPFEIVVDARQRVDITMKVAGTNDTVTVNAGGEVGLDIDTSERGTVLGEREITDLPLNGREYTDLALLVPGVQVSDLQDGSVEQRRGSFHTNGHAVVGEQLSAGRSGQQCLSRWESGIQQ